MVAGKGQEYRRNLAGIAKGAGMIAPNMATMLGLLATDAYVEPNEIHNTLKRIADRSFNRIVVDGDMSTNDTLLLLANGDKYDIDAYHPVAFPFHATYIAEKLARDIVRDGEGATKFITLRIDGAPDNETARQIGNAIATSPLVKTAFYGGDANWGRIIAAAGRSGVAVDPAKMSLTFQSDDGKDALKLFEGGVPTQYDESAATALVKADSVTVILDCGMGSESATIWTCDLSHDYISINGHYRS
jgi:glutamate N-acetyltransferase/amino-acid N-acetyltransferase